MANNVNFERVASESLRRLPSILYEWFPSGKLDGREFKIGDIQGSPGESLAINIQTGKWADFAADLKGGDLISLYAAKLAGGSPSGKDQVAAAKKLGEMFGISEQPQASMIPEWFKGRKNEKWVAQPFVPDDAPQPPNEHFKYGKPTATWKYFDNQNRLVGQVCRFDLAGKKVVLPQTWCKSATQGGTGWKWKAFAQPRPLYNLASLAKFPEKVVFIVEGEKTADAAQRFFECNPVVTWAGGSKAYKLTDFTPLQGRKIAILPDNDQPGIDAAEAIATHLLSLGCIVKICRYRTEDDHLPEGWDLADEDGKWDNAYAWQWVIDRLVPWEAKPETQPKKSTKREPQPDISPEPLDEQKYFSESAESQELPPYEGFDFEPPMQKPFRVLGYNNGLYYYYPDGASQVVELSASAHTKNNLFRLAPYGWWQSQYPHPKNDVNWDQAANDLIQSSVNAGVFITKDKLRGRGAWLDNGRTILNFGDQLLVDMVPTPFSLVASENFYQAGPRIPFQIDYELSSPQAGALIDICRMLRWEKPISAYLLAGWATIAPMAGILPWRPHIWINGPSGCGKSTVVREILNRIIGNIAIIAEGKTTEAGIRQTLGYDAIPVIFDEFEPGGDSKSNSIVQEVIELARIASSGGHVVKGTAGQSGAKAYNIRSCFAFASINNGTQNYQDLTRVTALSLQKPLRLSKTEKNEHYDLLMTMIREHLTREFGQRLLVRTVKNIHVLLNNSETFTIAVAKHLGSRRIADQLGPMLAGAYLLTSTKKIDVDAAFAWIQERDWSDHEIEEADKNENQLLSTLMQHRIPVQTTNTNFGHWAIGEVVSVAHGLKVTDLKQHEAERILAQYGMRIKVNSASASGEGWEYGVFISNTHTAIKAILRGTPWEKRWNKQLESLEGARKPEAKTSLNGTSSRMVWVPVELFLDEKIDR
ncbi:MAG: hypothetical protein HQL74_07470 [Magnetococcales bacterium]|nr:hypothetical protein [Magnetococcales bacterium]